MTAMDMTKETIKTEGCQLLLDAFQCVGIRRRVIIIHYNRTVIKLRYKVSEVSEL
jgi:hypothetical protein